ncbi:MAG: Abi family protein [Oscillospiraceae bacterium]
MKPKSINALMAYMRDNKGIQINGSLQKKKLRYMGYFHGYKGYRYCNTPSSLLPYNNFNELQSVYEFDMKLKAILYPQIMFLETSLKNYALEEVLNQANSNRFADVYAQLLNDYRSYPINSDLYKKAINKRMTLRNKIYSVISRDYGKNNIVSHYYDSNRQVPIWAIFELISLGEFGNFLSCLNESIRLKISQSVGIKIGIDADGRMVEKMVYALKDLRNAVAHNNTVFDTRFKTGSVNSRISRYITSEIQIKNLTFDTIVDYVILISFIMKLIGKNKTDILIFIRQFEDVCENLRKAIPTNIYNRIVHTDTRGKLNALKKYL